MRVRVVGIVVLVVLAAGCNGFLGGPDQDVERATPAPVPTLPATPSDERVGIAPGITTTNVTHPEFLASRHVEAVDSARYVWREQYREYRGTAGSNTTVTRGQRVVVENASVYRRDSSSYQTRVDGQRVIRQPYNVWANGDVSYRSWAGSDGREFRRSEHIGSTRPYAELAAGPISRYLDVQRVSVSRYEVGGSERGYYLVRGQNATLPTMSGVENYSARAVVREDGFVRRVDVSYDLRNGHPPIAVHYNFTYVDVGTATVTPPEWADDARAAFENPGMMQNETVVHFTDAAHGGRTRAG